MAINDIDVRVKELTGTATWELTAGTGIAYQLDIMERGNTITLNMVSIANPTWIVPFNSNDRPIITPETKLRIGTNQQSGRTFADDYGITWEQVNDGTGSTQVGGGLGQAITRVFNRSTSAEVDLFTPAANTVWRVVWASGGMRIKDRTTTAAINPDTSQGIAADIIDVKMVDDTTKIISRSGAVTQFLPQYVGFSIVRVA